MRNYIDINELKGKTLSEVKQIKDDKIIFKTTDGMVYLMYHAQDCCEDVEIEDIDGDLNDLVGNEILMAESVSNTDQGAKDKYDDSYTWTYYKLATVKGYVTIRWYGSSNGYYSEDVEINEYNSVEEFEDYGYTF